MLATASAGVLAAVDAIKEAQGWADLGLPGLLIVALVFVVRELQQERAEGRKERDEREERMLEALNKNAESLNQLTTLTKEQTDYFKSVTRNIVEQHIKGPGHLP